MRILYKRILEDGVALIEAAGVSLEDKPTAGIATGSKFIEVDTGKEYRFAEGDNLGEFASGCDSGSWFVFQ